MSPEIIPAVLAKTEKDFKERIDSLPKELLLQIDVLERDVWVDSDRPFEAHLMVEEPERIFAAWLSRGAKRIIVHKEMEKFLHHAGEVELGLGVEMQVQLEEIYPILEHVDFVQLMAIKQIGAQGHPLDEKIFARIKKVKEKFPHLPISIDGGVNAGNYESLLEAGAERLVVGSGFNDLWLSLTNKN